MDISFLGIWALFMEQDYLNMGRNIYQVNDIMVKQYSKHQGSLK